MKVIIVCILCLRCCVLPFFSTHFYSFTFSVTFHYIFSFRFISLGISRHLLLDSLSPLSYWRHLHISFIPSSGPKEARHRIEGEELKLKLKCHLSPKPFFNVSNWRRFLIWFLYSKLVWLTIFIIRNVSHRSESRDLKHPTFSKRGGNGVELSVQARMYTNYNFLRFLPSPYFDPSSFHLLLLFTYLLPFLSLSYLSYLSRFRHPFYQLP